MSGPNILFIMADDMGYGDFGLFNDGLTQTPTLDNFAGEGICLTQHYSASCVCTPARAGFLTGRYPHRTGAIEMRSVRGYDRLALRERTVADLFRGLGYRTGLVGKWHTGVYGAEYHPNRRGFEEFFGFRGGNMDYWDSHIERNGQVVAPDGNYLTDRLTEEAISFLQRHREEPFFLCLHYNAPHTPLQVPDGEEEEFLRPGVNRGVATVYAMIRRLDAGVGRVLEAVEKLGLAQDTCVFFTSDNGPQFGGQGENKLDRFNCNLAGSKGHVYDGGIRVPMLIRWPGGGVVGGGQRDDFVHYTDWLPTLLAVAGSEPPAEPALDGINVLPVLQGNDGQVLDTRFWQWNRYTPLREYNIAMREGNWKLVRPACPAALWTSPEEMAMDRRYEHDPDSFPGPLRTPEPERDFPDEPPPPELYDLAADPCEESNLADQNRGRVSRMMTEMETWFRSVEADRLAIDRQ